MPKTKTILLIEDDAALRGAIRGLLEEKGYRVVDAAAGAEGLRKARAQPPNLILSDWMLGDGPQGVEICAALKSASETRAIPIIIMTAAKVEFADELTALRSGADLYLNKSVVIGGGAGGSERFFSYAASLLERPFRVGAKTKAAAAAGLVIDLGAHTVKTKDETIANLPTKLFDVLYILARKHPGIVSRQELVGKVWKDRVRDREADVAVSRLKDRIETRKDEPLVESIYGRGYRLKVEPVIVSG